MKKIFLSLIILLAYPQFAQAEEPQVSQANEQATYYRELAQEERDKAREYEQKAENDREVARTLTNNANSMAHKSGFWVKEPGAKRSAVLTSLAELTLNSVNENERLASEAKERALEYEKMAFEILANSD